MLDDRTIIFLANYIYARTRLWFFFLLVCSFSPFEPCPGYLKPKVGACGLEAENNCMIRVNFRSLRRSPENYKTLSTSKSVNIDLQALLWPLLCKMMLCNWCSELLTLLLNIYNTVSTQCSPAAAKAVVSYMAHLKTLQDLESVEESSCPSGIA